jgi:hypothetical protein
LSDLSAVAHSAKAEAKAGNAPSPHGEAVEEKSEERCCDLSALPLIGEMGCDELCPGPETAAGLLFG